MLTGRRAFARPTIVESLAALLDEAPPEFHSDIHTVPIALQQIVIRCLSKAPHARFESAVDLAIALETLDTPDDRPAQLDSLAVLPLPTPATPTPST